MKSSRRLASPRFSDASDHERTRQACAFKPPLDDLACQEIGHEILWMETLHRLRSPGLSVCPGKELHSCDSIIRLRTPSDDEDEFFRLEYLVVRGFDAAKFNREMRAAQRKAEAAVKREVDRVNRENQRLVDAHNRKVDQHNKKVVADYNRKVDQHNKKVVADYNRQADARKRTVIADLKRQLRSASSGPRYTTDEQALADRVQNDIAQRDDREWDIFLSYARIDDTEI